MSKFLNEFDAKNLLSDYGLPMAKSLAVTNKTEALKLSAQLEFPIVMKILSADIQHKTEAGCVFPGVREPEVADTFDKIMAHAHAYAPGAAIEGVLMQELAGKGLEVIIGMKKDPQFGPVIMAGGGGIYVEVYKDVALRLLPVDRQEIKRMLKETKLHQIISGARGTVYDEEALVSCLMSVAKLAMEQPSIEEIDINPLFLYEKGKGAKGVDALIRAAAHS